MPDWHDDRTSSPRGAKDGAKKIPTEVYAQVVAGGKSEEKRIFDVFRGAGCDWDEAKVEEEVGNIHRNQDASDWQWCTRDQAAKIFGNREVADAKCDVAEKDPTRFQVDEDCPEMEAAYQYWIKTKEGATENRVKEHHKRTKFSAAASDEQAAQISRTMMPAHLAAGRYVSPPAKAGQPSPQTPALETDEQKKAVEEEAKAAKAKEEAAAAEKERKKQEAAKAKAEARAKLQNSPSFQISKWLSGM